MLNDLRAAFRQAIHNFKTELNRDDVPGSVDRLLHGMREELIDARAYVSRLEGEIRRTLDAAGKEEREAEVCLRREAMATKIGDGDTAAVAADFAVKHGRRRDVLNRKALALKEELEVRRSEAAEMEAAFKEARGRRDGLAATVGRAGTRETIREADDLFEELDRMAEKISDLERSNAATEELLADDPLSEEPLDRHPFGENPAEPSGGSPDPDALDARLRELKRRMGRD